MASKMLQNQEEANIILRGPYLIQIGWFRFVFKRFIFLLSPYLPAFRNMKLSSQVKVFFPALAASVWLWEKVTITLTASL